MINFKYILLILSVIRQVLNNCLFIITGTTCTTNKECSEINNGYNLVSNTLISYSHGVGCNIDFNIKPGFYKLVTGYAQCNDTFTCISAITSNSICNEMNIFKLIPINNDINLCIKTYNINGIALKKEHYFVIPFADTKDTFLVKSKYFDFKINNMNEDNDYYIVKNSKKSINFYIDTKSIKIREKDIFKSNLINSHPKIALCAIAKNENLYIREWVEYYKNIGISKIFLYDNNELDGEKFEEVINDYIKNDFVEVIDRRGIIKNVNDGKKGSTTQGDAYYDCYYNNYKKYNWMFFFDIDEFLSIDYKYSNIFEFLNDFNEYDGIKIQWRMFGDNGNLFYENKPVIERFLSKNNIGYDRQQKSILKCREYDFDLKFSAHGIINKELFIVNVIKQKVKHIYWDSKAYSDLPVYLNHFYSKSTEEYIKRKYNKTSAVTGINHSRNFSLNFLKKKYFEYNKFTKEKESIFSFLE